ncbi:hypothetical protein DN052_01610 [Acidithiobacillus ferrooxidans]|uniref:Uncharacterized protein n=1 Tax=Acidithiobacillus ferrooxidans TaxID=920 RepID=A0A2W1K520_ACIFR|nr:hypothetical protein DN052_01610 [Acidithiobacillus ferrooxidans]
MPRIRTESSGMQTAHFLHMPVPQNHRVTALSITLFSQSFNNGPILFVVFHAVKKLKYIFFSRVFILLEHG